MATQNLSGYAVGGTSSSASTPTDSDKDKGSGKYWSLRKLKRAYLDYLGNKREEIDEQQDARRFVHGSQWTSEEIKQLNLRKQPVVWNNKTKRKINGIIGTLQRLKQDPKAYARTPKHEQGAELATAALRYALERAQFERKDPIAAEMCAIDGMGGIEFNIVGDEIDIDAVWTDGFFYDPRSVQDDFSDARYMGVGKWMDFEGALDLFPDKEEEIQAALNAGEELSTDSDRDMRQWFSTEGEIDRLRLVECWYLHKGKWCWGVFTGVNKLSEGKSPFQDEDGNSIHKYEMFSAYIDQDGDRYGFVRDLKPLNKEINMRRSKALFTMLSRRIIAPIGAFDDVEQARREASRSDGMVIYNPTGEDRPQFDDTARSAETEAQFKFLEDVKTDFESFGPNVAVTGEGLENSSGRAIHLLQQAGLADLGPFIQSYRGWKLRIYRKAWNTIQRVWTGERWIRVTDDDDLSQYIQLNQVGIDPMTGQPTIVNAIGQLDVDIILDEGPDAVNVMSDAYDTLTALAGQGSQIPPDVLIELAPLPASIKKRLLEKLNPEPTPEQQQMQQTEMQMASETVNEKAASAKLKEAQAYKAMAEAQAGPDISIEQGEDPMLVNAESMEKQAGAMQKAADAEKKRAETEKIRQDIALEPQRMMMEQADRVMQQRNAEEDRFVQQQNAQADRAVQARDSDRQFAQQARESDRQFSQQAKDSDRNYQVNKMKAAQKPSTTKGNK